MYIFFFSDLLLLKILIREIFFVRWINKKIHCLLCYKSVLELVPKEIVSDQIIAKIDGH
jgi:hypothetical protein